MSGIRAVRIADFHRGVLIPLGEFTDGELTFSVRLDLESEEGFDPKVIENRVKETIRQIGAEVDLEDLR